MTFSFVSGSWSPTRRLSGSFGHSDSGHMAVQDWKWGE